MEIIHKTVTVPESHVISITLPKNIVPGEIEIALVLNAKTISLEQQNDISSAVSNSENLKKAALSKLADLLNADGSPVNSSEEEKPA